MLSSVALDASSGSVTTSLTSNARALTIMKQTFSVAIDRLGGFFDTLHLTRPKVLATLMSRFRLDGARQARAVDLLIDPPHAVIDSSSQSLVRIFISAHGFSGLITSSPLIAIFTISFASRSIFKRSSMRIWLLS